MRNFIYYLIHGNTDIKKMAIKGMLPQKLSAALFYYKYHHKPLNFKNPELMDEKLLILQIRYNSDPQISHLADKYAVREYISSVGYPDILNPLIGVYDRAEDIDIASLPMRFAAKCNHASGFNIIVRDKKTLDENKFRDTLNSWLLDDYGILKGERHYSGIRPRIVIEEFLEDKNGLFPCDYKFFCSRGKVTGCLVITGRGQYNTSGEEGKERCFVDKDFSDTGYINEYTGDNIKDLKPPCYEEMWKAAQKLSEPFPFVRVDLYNKDGRIVFGELTFTPHSCVHPHINLKGQKEIGKQIIM